MAELLAVPVTVGVVVALLVALTLVPFVALHPRADEGAGRRVLRWSVVTGYVAAVAAATLVPLPAPGAQECPSGGGRLQLVPLAFLSRVGATGAAGEVLLQVGLNVALFVPLGVLLRHWWGLTPAAAAGVAALASLGIELTQLTGVWFLYDCPHRVADVDDVLANTLGGLLGALLSGARPPAGRT